MKKKIRFEAPVFKPRSELSRLTTIQEEFKEIVSSGIPSKRVRAKLAGYGKQDTLRRPSLPPASIDPRALARQMLDCGFKCHYCQQWLTSGQERPNSSTQWTLDRVNNNLNHSLENCVLCCLACNIKRGRKDAAVFKKWRKITIVKKSSFSE